MSRLIIPFAFCVLLAACGTDKPGTETAGATVAEANRGAIPVTAASAEARELYLRGRELTENLRAHDGRRLYREAVAKDPTFAMAHYQLAFNAATAKDFFDHLKHAVELAGEVSEGERLMILALEAGGNAEPAKSVEYQEQVVARYPDDERAHFLLGNGYFGQQHYDRAIEQYEAATAINPGYAPAYNLLGYALRSLERYEESEAAFLKYIELIPADPNPYDSYAELLMKTGRFDESIVQYRKALEIDSNFTPSRVGIATNLMLQGKHPKAAAVMSELHQRARDDGDRRTAFFTTAVILVDAGKTDAAIREIEQEYALDARRGDTANMSGDAQLLGDILLDAGRTAAAADRFAQALELVERSSLSDEVKADTRLADRYNRARVSLANGDLTAAKAEAKAYAEGAEARRNAFRIRQAHDLAGTIALAEKRWGQALDHFGQANQQDPQVLYRTALAWQGQGDGTRAREFATRAAEANTLPLITYAFVREKAKQLEL